jgi:hypothetical protein
MYSSALAPKIIPNRQTRRDASYKRDRCCGSRTQDVTSNLNKLAVARERFARRAARTAHENSMRQTGGRLRLLGLFCSRRGSSVDFYEILPGESSPEDHRAADTCNLRSQLHSRCMRQRPSAVSVFHDYSRARVWQREPLSGRKILRRIAFSGACRRLRHEL